MVGEVRTHIQRVVILFHPEHMERCRFPHIMA